MKRALVFAAVISMFAFAGLAQFSGEWMGEISLLPEPPALSYTMFILNYNVAGWDLSSTSLFLSSGWASQKFGFDGSVGPVSISGSMGFDPSVPAYAYTDISSSMDFAGMSITGKIFHGIYPYGVDHFDDAYYPYTFDGVWGDCTDDALQTGKALLFYTLSVDVDPFSATIHFVDCCTGTEFYDASISLSGIGLCCGVTYDVTLAFDKKDGFKYLDFYVDHLFDLCCGISFGAEVTFTTTGKSLAVYPSWAGIEGCVTVYGDIDADKNGVDGWELYGWKINCEFSDCNKLEIFTATKPEVMYVDSAGNLYAAPSDTLIARQHLKPLFEGSEFEYIKLSFCGAACCGGNWSLDFQAFFQESGSLFGVTRASIDATVPVMDNLSFTISFAPAFTSSDETSLSIGWDFTF